VSLFSANHDGGAIRAPAQARRGLSQAIGHCTLCKVLQRNVAPLHIDARTRRDWAKADTPGFIGRKKEKREFQPVFKFVIDHFQPWKTSLCRGREIAVGQAGEGLQLICPFAQTYARRAAVFSIFRYLKKRANERISGVFK